MFIHKSYSEKFTKNDNTNSLWKIISDFFKKKDIMYKFSDESLTLDELKHGILRENKYCDTFKGFSRDSVKNELIQEGLCPKIISLFFEDQNSPVKLEEFNESNPNFLSSVFEDYIDMNVVYEKNESYMILPSSFQKYYKDFGSSIKNIMEILSDGSENMKALDLLKKLEEGKIRISFYVNFED